MHGGKGETIDIAGRSRGVGTPSIPSKQQNLLKRIQILGGEEYIREVVRLRAREDYKILGISALMDYHVLDALG